MNGSLGNVWKNTLIDRSSSAGPEQEAVHWVVEAKEDADQEGMRLGGDLVEKLRVEWREIWIEIRAVKAREYGLRDSGLLIVVAQCQRGPKRVECRDIGVE